MNAKPLIGLALRAGASRGWAHIGVIQRLEEAGIVPDIVCGTSSGALVGGFYSAGKLNVLEDWVRGLSLRRLLSFVRVRCACSLFGKSMLRQLATHGRKVTLGELQVRFVAVAVDLASGREVRIERGSLVRAVAASGACPGLFPPIKVDGRWMVDGVLVEPVPVAACRALGADFVIAVNPFGSRREDRGFATVASVCAKTLWGAMGVLSRLVPRKVARAMRLKEVKMRRSIRPPETAAVRAHGDDAIGEHVAKAPGPARNVCFAARPDHRAATGSDDRRGPGGQGDCGRPPGGGDGASWEHETD